MAPAAPLLWTSTVLKPSRRRSLGVNLVVDPVPPHPELTAERLVLREGGALIDVSMRPAAAARQLRAEPTTARGTVVLCGSRIEGAGGIGFSTDAELPARRSSGSREPGAS